MGARGFERGYQDEFDVSPEAVASMDVTCKQALFVTLLADPLALPARVGRSQLSGSRERGVR